MSGILLLSIIYLAFISLGLPDSLLGVAWPVMRTEFGADLEVAGWLFMTIAGGTIISSLFSGKILNRFETSHVTAFCAAITASSLLGFYFAPSLIWLFLLSIPLGLGAGVVDAALNHFVATRYKAHHMNWLHCFWGVGATTGPLIMAAMMSESSEWRSGYLTVALTQFGLALVLLLSLPLWKQAPVAVSDVPDDLSLTDTASKRLVGLPFALASFVLYCGAEALIGLWGSSYLVQVKSFSVQTAATWISVYYGSITVGRFLSGFLSLRLTNRQLIRAGQGTALVGSLLFFLPLDGLMLTGFILIGLGLAPIYPAMLHETPVRFGRDAAKRLMGIQMAFAYSGSTFLPPLFGVLASLLTLQLFPVTGFLMILFLLLCSERLNRVLAKRALSRAS